MLQSLETSLERLNALDRWRVESASLRDKGKTALRDLPSASVSGGASKWHDPFGSDAAATPGVGAVRIRGSQILEDATVLRALLCHRRYDGGKIGVPATELVTRLEESKLDALAEHEDDNLPILRAARVLTALAAAPESALSKTAVFCYYLIICELYAGDAPDWLIGGARGGEGLASCAFVTNECIHALLAFERTLLHTAEHVESILEMRQRRRPPESLHLFPDMPEWLEVDDKRARLDLEITSELRKANIALHLDSIGETPMPDFLENVHSKIQEQMEKCLEEMEAAVSDISEYFKAGQSVGERDDDVQRRIRRVASHDLAMCVLDAARSALKKAVHPIPNEPETSAEVALGAASWFFRTMVFDVRRVLEPASVYVSRVLDRELTAAASGSAVWDVGELVFAAISHGYLSGRWEEARLKQAAVHVSQVVSERGWFPTGKPVHFSRRGYNLHVLNIDILRALAELLHHTPVAVDDGLVKRLMTFIKDTTVAGSPLPTWVPSEELRNGRPWRSVTASTVLALDAINRMLDVRINEDIFPYFSVRHPQALNVPKLNDLFYPDYGLASVKCEPTVRRTDSVAVTLERMRAHVSGVLLSSEYHEGLFSLILHGPPGTGKTTLVESLAKTSNVRLIEITPSDLIAGGVDAIERTARAVFRALSLLTRVVIIFDEFDPVLLRRHDDQKEATAFSFLTPGMLPKLKDLHAAAKRRSVAYVLNTNLIGKLDDAAIRGGRFDARVGIYPPDLLSRAGRLAWAIGKYLRQTEDRVDLPPNMVDRFEQAVMRVRLGPMNTLATSGWFSAPRERPEQMRTAADVFNHLFRASSLKVPDTEAEPRLASEKPVALQELREHLYVALWDEQSLKVDAADLQVGEIADGDTSSDDACELPPRKLAKAFGERPAGADVDGALANLRQSRGFAERWPA